LTEKGRDFISDFFPKHLDHIRQEFEVLTQKEKKSLAEICKKLGLKQ